MAQCALDATLSVAATSELPEQSEIVLVGAGLAGLLLASTFAKVASVAVLEGSATVAGTWRHHGEGSRIQITTAALPATL